MSARTSVVLPAPFGPTSPNTSPASTVTETPLSATVSPYDRRRSSATTTGSLVMFDSGGWRA
ncbi:MAG: hypothetical protein J07HB67_01823 [halophilic archaeon J07HB67]|nr:MAG: hypothetical protein J07HB67_01823 [halophilic archaeon J07HB67]